MASIFTTTSNKFIQHAFGKKEKVPFYLQFVPGVVVHVVHSQDSYAYDGTDTINTIIASPHITSDIVRRKVLLSPTEHRYYPLLRGINDVPTKGDPIILCTIGGTNYYLGPLNTTSNNPTWNDDPLYREEMSLGLDKYNVDDDNPTNIINERGQTKNFNKSSIWSRLIKYRKEDLDYGTAVHETTGDTIFEGRHGNSMRIGSRSASPYIFISNGRNPSQDIEQLSDGSLISITSNGSLDQHFPNPAIKFILASDTVVEDDMARSEPPRLMADLVKSVNVGEVNRNDRDEVYDYATNQILLNSSRITLNSRNDDIYLSSNKDIHIGTKRHLTITTNEDLIISCQNTYLGNPFTSSDLQQMVLGNKLLDVLKDIVSLFKKVKSISEAGELPLVLPSAVSQVEQKIDTILSSKHYIGE